MMFTKDDQLGNGLTLDGHSLLSAIEDIGQQKKKEQREEAKWLKKQKRRKEKAEHELAMQKRLAEVNHCDIIRH